MIFKCAEQVLQRHYVVPGMIMLTNRADQSFAFAGLLYAYVVEHLAIVKISFFTAEIFEFEEGLCLYFRHDFL